MAKALLQDQAVRGDQYLKEAAEVVSGRAHLLPLTEI